MSSSSRCRWWRCQHAWPNPSSTKWCRWWRCFLIHFLFRVCILSHCLFLASSCGVIEVMCPVVWIYVPVFTVMYVSDGRKEGTACPDPSFPFKWTVMRKTDSTLRRDFLSILWLFYRFRSLTCISSFSCLVESKGFFLRVLLPLRLFIKASYTQEPLCGFTLSRFVSLLVPCVSVTTQSERRSTSSVHDDPQWGTSRKERINHPIMRISPFSLSFFDVSMVRWRTRVRWGKGSSWWSPGPKRRW